MGNPSGPLPLQGGGVYFATPSAYQRGSMKPFPAILGQSSNCQTVWLSPLKFDCAERLRTVPLLIREGSTMPRCPLPAMKRNPWFGRSFGWFTKGRSTRSCYSVVLRPCIGRGCPFGSLPTSRAFVGSAVPPHWRRVSHISSFP